MFIKQMYSQLNRDLLIRQTIAEAYNDGSTIKIRPQKKRTVLLNETQTPTVCTSDGKYVSYIGGDVYQLPVETRGCLRKSTVINDKPTQEQLQFLTWCWKVRMN